MNFFTLFIDQELSFVYGLSRKMSFRTSLRFGHSAMKWKNVSNSSLQKRHTEDMYGSMCFDVCLGNCARLLLFFLDAPPPTGQWGARRFTGGYNTRHDIFAPWAGINEDLLYAHALATDHTWYGMDWDWLERH